MPVPRKACPDCDRPLTDTRIIDKLDPGSLCKHGVLEYAVGEAKPSTWTGRFPIKGDVAASRCDACGRVLLLANPKKQ